MLGSCRNTTSPGWIIGRTSYPSIGLLRSIRSVRELEHVLRSRVVAQCLLGDLPVRVTGLHEHVRHGRLLGGIGFEVGSLDRDQVDLVTWTEHRRVVVAEPRTRWRSMRACV